jgi:hypothetical protein
MATHTGVDGLIKIGSNAVAELRGYSYTETATTTDDTSQTDTWTTHLPGLKSWSGQAEAAWDETDTTGQGALLVGASVSLTFYPEGATTGDVTAAGTATVTSVGVSVPNGSGLVTRSFSFTGNGALTHGTAA